MLVTAEFCCFWQLFHDENAWNFLWMWPPSLPCHMPKTVPSNPSLKMLQAKNITFVHKSKMADKRWATDARRLQQQQQQWQVTQVDRVHSLCCCCCCCCLHRIKHVRIGRLPSTVSAEYLNLSRPCLTWCFHDLGVPQGGPGGREAPFQSLSLSFSGQKSQNSAATGTALLSTHHT